MLPRPRILLALLLTTAALPAAAFHDPGPPVLDQVRVTEDTYVAWRVLMTQDGPLGVESQLTSREARMVSNGVWFLNGVLGLQAAIVSTSWREGGSRLHVELPDPVGPLVRTTEGGGLVQINGVASDAEVAAGGYVLIAFASADGAMDAELTLVAGPGAILLGKTTGPAFLHREADFRGGLNVALDVPTAAGPLLVKAIEDVQVQEQVEGRLFMTYTGLSNSGDLALSLDHPGGHRDLVCVWVEGFCASSAFLHGGASGSWELNIDRATDQYDTVGACDILNSAGECVPPHIFASGADVAIP